MAITLRILDEVMQQVCKLQSQVDYWIRRYGVSIGMGFIILVNSALPASSQSYSTSTGIPSFSTPEPVELGFVDASNGNLHLSIPLGSYQQRGASKAQNITLEYDSNVWQTSEIICSPSLTICTEPQWLPEGPNEGSGWYTSFPWVFSPIAAQSLNCQTDIPWSDQNGTVHYFHFTTGAGIFNSNTALSSCTGESDAFASDSSGYHMYVWNRLGNSQAGDNGSLGFVSYAPDGTIADSDCWGTCPSGLGVDSNDVGTFGKDSNGNYLYGLYSDRLTDTLGRQITGGDTSMFGGAGDQVITVPNSQGTAQYKVTWAVINVYTSFNEVGIDEFTKGSGSTWPFRVIQSLTLPDSSGSTYNFTYDCDQTDATNPVGVCSSSGGAGGLLWGNYWYNITNWGTGYLFL